MTSRTRLSGSCLVPNVSDANCQPTGDVSSLVDNQPAFPEGTRIQALVLGDVFRSCQTFEFTSKRPVFFPSSSLPFPSLFDLRLIKRNLTSANWYALSVQWTKPVKLRNWCFTTVISFLAPDHECTTMLNFFVFKQGSFDETATASCKPKLEFTGSHTQSHRYDERYSCKKKKKKGSSRTIKASHSKWKGATRSRRITASFRTGFQAGEESGEAHMPPSEKKGRNRERCLHGHRSAYLLVTLIRESEWRHGLSLSLREHMHVQIGKVQLRSFHIPIIM